VEQKQASGMSVTDKFSRLSVTDSANELDAERRCENSAGNQSDQPPSKKTKNSRSRRRRKGHRVDAAVAVNGGVTCEFVRGGRGKMHSSSGSRQDWFSVDGNNKHGSLDTDSRGSDVALTRDNKERQDGVDRKTATPLLAVETSTTKSGKTSGAVTSRTKEPKNNHSAKVIDAVQSSKMSASKELSADKRPVAAQKNSVSVSASEVNKSSKARPARLESGWLYCVLHQK